MSIYDPMTNPRRPRPRKSWYGIFLAVLLFYAVGHGLISGGVARLDPRVPTIRAEQGGLAQVVRVVDGDTIIVKRGNVEERVRLLGIDAPESVHPSKPAEPFGEEASLFLKELLGHGTVRLAGDPLADEKDKYGRTLAYVFRGSDGLLVNRELVAKGYAEVYRAAPLSTRQSFLQLEREAKRKRLGMWK